MMRSLTKPFKILALAVVISSISLAQEKPSSPQVEAKEPTVVTVHGKQGQVDTAAAAQSERLKERSLPAKIGLGIVKGVKKAFTAAFNWTEDSLGIHDDTDPKQPKER